MRDEIRMSIDAYRSIYESSKSFGSKREESIDAEDRDPNELEAKIAEIEGDKMNLQNLIQAMQDNMALKEIKHKELVDAETKKHNEEVEFLKKVHDQLEVSSQIHEFIIL
jgi:dynein light intermediate chain